MRTARDDWPFLEDAWVFALVRTGNEAAATALLKGALDEMLGHPDAGDPEAAKRLLFQRLVREGLEFETAPPATDGELAVQPLHALPDPARSATVLEALGVFHGRDLVKIIGKTSPSEVDPTIIGRLGALDLSQDTRDALAAMRASAAEQKARQRWNPRDPAFLSVVVGFLLLLALLTWNFLGRVGVFPEDALTIAEEVVKIGPDQFDAIEVPAADAADWFLLKGFEKFPVPAEFAGSKAAGARLATVDKLPVAVLIVPENLMYFVVFDPKPLGISIGSGWRIAEFNLKYAAALREEGGMCFMVVVRGSKAQLEKILAKR